MAKHELNLEDMITFTDKEFAQIESAIEVKNIDQKDLLRQEEALRKRLNKGV